MPKISLEQWQAFKSVVDEGSFAAAAEALNKSQSSISYAIARLNEQLPTPVLQLHGRKAVMTEAGQVLYRHACVLLNQAMQVERTASYLASGWESEVVLAVDTIAPMTELFSALTRFSQVNPATRIRILETTLSGTDEAILLRQAHIALTPHIPVGFHGQLFCTTTLIAVAAGKHPLITAGHTITEEELKQYRQIVIRDSGIKRNRDAGWLAAEQRWTVSHPATSVSAVKSGLGFAFLPLSRIAKELERGDLLPIPLARDGTRSLPLYLVLSDGDFAGPATQAVAEQLLSSSRPE